MSLSTATLLVFWTTVIFAQSPEPEPNRSDAERLAEANRTYAEGAAAYEKKDFAKAAELYVQAFELGATQPAVPYNTACCFALLGKSDDAFKYLDLALQYGWRNLEHLQSDADLKSLHEDKRWEDIVERCTKNRDAFRKAMTHPDLFDELMRCIKVDQEARLAPNVNGLVLMKIDSENTAWMKEMIDKHGWPGFDMVGREGASAAWLLVQHADLDHAFQRRCLELITQAYDKGQAAADHVAYLTDRVLVAENKPQIYGTQFHTMNGRQEPFPIEDEKHVDERRAKMGLRPLAEYAKHMRTMYGP